VWLQINWQTGATTQHWVDRPVKYYREQANVESLRQRLTALKAEGLTDQVIADRLHQEGYTTTQGTAMTRGAVWYLRRRWQIGSARQERRQGTRYQWPDGRYTLNGVAELIGVHVRTVLSWIERGMIVADQAYKGGALKIALNPEQIDALRRHVAQVRRPRRSPQPPQDVSAGHP
jgi:DNA-binding transcriptional MerR regulator